MKTKINSILAITFCVIVTILSSCNSNKKGEIVVVSKSASDSVIALELKKTDSLLGIINGLLSTEYDLKVAALKKLPQYKNAIFLSPKECAEYLVIFSKLASKFKKETVYRSYFDQNFIEIDDSTLEQSNKSSNCKIVFDTTQSLIPLARIRSDYYTTYKNKKSKKEQFESAHSKFEFYYIPKIRIGYAIATFSSGGTELFQKGMSGFDSDELKFRN